MVLVTDHPLDAPMLATARTLEQADVVPVPDPSHVEIREDELQVFVAGARVGFTVREFQIFNVLAQRPDRVVRRAEIHGQVWGAAWVHRDRSVDVFVRKIRRKLSAVSPDWTYVHTHFGIGYRYHPERCPPD